MGTTRLGGDPDLPAGSEFPTDSRGGPLHFLGQFDLEEIHGFVGGRAFPADGLLSIFRTQAEGKNCYPGPADWPRFVRRIPKGTTLERSARPEGNGEPPAPYRPDLVLRDSLRLPASPDKWAGLTIDYKQMWRFDGLLPATLRGEAFILLGHAVHGNTGDEPLLERPDWLQLLLVPFVEGPDFGISDMSLSLHLPAADLKLGRFDRLETSFG